MGTQERTEARERDTERRQNIAEDEEKRDLKFAEKKKARDALNKKRLEEGKKAKKDYGDRWRRVATGDWLGGVGDNKSIRKERRSARKGVAKARLRFQETEDLLEDLNEGDGGPIYKFFWANELRFKIIAESVVTVPVEFAFHFLVTIGPFITMTAVGVVWVLVWMSVEHIALHAK